MANELLILPLHLIQSALGQKVEAKPARGSRRERSQGRAVMRGLEVACLPGAMGLPLSRNQGRATSSLAKSDLTAYFLSGRAAAHAVNGVLLIPVPQAITSHTRNAHLTDEVPWCPRSTRVEVNGVYKSQTKGSPDAPAMETGSPRLHPWGCRQRQSRGPRPRGNLERQNLRVFSGPLRSTDSVSPKSQATKWPGGTSFRQRFGSLRNEFTHPENARWAVRTR